MKLGLKILTISLPLLLLFCTHEKFPLPSITDEPVSNLRQARYVQLNTPLDAANGYSFNKPADIYSGVDNFIYIADTGNDRIVMMDLGGAIQGFSKTIPHPEAITQNDSLQLLVVNKTNVVYRLDLFKHNHQIGEADVDTVYRQEGEPSRQFTGITVHGGFEYYVTVVDTADSSLNFLEFSFIYDFYPNHTLKGPLPLQVNGTGLFSAIVPSAIVSMRERFLDISSQENTLEFWFTQKGKTRLLKNNFKVQSVTSRIVEGGTVIVPNTNLIGSDVYAINKYYFPEDIAIDRSGFVFVVDKGREISDPDTTKPLPGFYRFAPSGLQLQSVSGAGSGVGQFNSPKGIAVTPIVEQNQIVYVADTGNNRILMFILSTEI